jgi:dipeptidyl-peptidase-4
MRLLRLVPSLLLFIVAAPLVAQEVAVEPLTLDRLYSSRDFFGQRFGPARWLDGGVYTTLERSADTSDGGGRDIVKHNARSGEREVLVLASALVPADQERPLAISNYIWSADHARLLIFTNTRRVWRTNTRGDYWVLDVASGNLRQLGGDAPEASLMFAKFSPDGTRVGYVSENNIYVEDLSTGNITQLTDDGSKTIINGTFDWVYEEELSLQDGFRWSPDGTQIAYWQLDASGVRDFLLINNTDSLYSYVIPIQYPKAGTTNSAARIGVVPAAGGDTRWFAIEGDPRNNYLARMDWAESSDEVIIQQLNRLQNENRVLLGDARTGTVRRIMTETDSAWLDVGDDLHWLDGGKAFTWVSERDGWRRVYRVSRDGASIMPITPANVDIMSVVRVDQKGGWLYYIASPTNATQRYLFRARLNRKGKAQRVTPMDAAGTHSYQMAPDAKWAFHTFSNFETPTVRSLVTIPKHRVLRTLVTNDSLRAKVGAIKRRPTEFFRVDIGDGVELDGWLMMPNDFDASKKYPVLFFVYSEPAAQTVLDRWSGRRMLWHQLLTEKGYLVASIDNRGTPAPRGRAWRKIVYREIGTIASADQAAAVQALIRERPYIDAERIGVWGWSGGGSMTLNAMFRYPEIYHTGMSVAPVPDETLYDTIYQERYMGLPDENAEGYRKGSSITYAENLKGNLLIVHGTGDDNVHFQGTERLINKLVEHNKRFTMMAYPNRSHGIFEGRGTTRHLYGLLTSFLTENLEPGPKVRAMP